MEQMMDFEAREDVKLADVSWSDRVIQEKVCPMISEYDQDRSLSWRLEQSHFHFEGQRSSFEDQWQRQLEINRMEFQEHLDVYFQKDQERWVAYFQKAQDQWDEYFEKKKNLVTEGLSCSLPPPVRGNLPTGYNSESKDSIMCGNATVLVTPRIVNYDSRNVLSELGILHVPVESVKFDQEIVDGVPLVVSSVDVNVSTGHSLNIALRLNDCDSQKVEVCDRISSHTSEHNICFDPGIALLSKVENDLEGSKAKEKPKIKLRTEVGDVYRYAKGLEYKFFKDEKCCEVEMDSSKKIKYVFCFTESRKRSQNDLTLEMFVEFLDNKHIDKAFGLVDIDGHNVVVSEDVSFNAFGFDPGIETFECNKSTKLDDKMVLEFLGKIFESIDKIKGVTVVNRLNESVTRSEFLCDGVQVVNELPRYRPMLVPKDYHWKFRDCLVICIDQEGILKIMDYSRNDHMNDVVLGEVSTFVSLFVLRETVRVELMVCFNYWFCGEVDIQVQMDVLTFLGRGKVKLKLL